MYFENDSIRFISYSERCLRNMGCGTSTRVYFLYLCVAPLAEGRRESCSTRRGSAGIVLHRAPLAEGRLESFSTRRGSAWGLVPHAEGRRIVAYLLHVSAAFLGSNF